MNVDPRPLSLYPGYSLSQWAPPVPQDPGIQGGLPPSLLKRMRFHSGCLCNLRSDCVFNLVLRGWPRQKLPKECKLFTNEYELSAHKGCILWGKTVVISVGFYHVILAALSSELGKLLTGRLYVCSQNWSAWKRLKAVITVGCLRNPTEGKCLATGSDLEYLSKTRLIMQEHTWGITWLFKRV